MKAKEWLISNKRSVAAVAILLVAVLVVNVYRGQMARLDEDMVDTYYQKHINAMRRFDAQTLCNLMADSYRSTDTVVVGRKTETIVYNKRRACDETKGSMRMMWEIVDKTKAEPEMQYTIAAITLSEDRTRAEVRIRGSMKIGKLLQTEFTGTETLIRRFGSVRSIGGESRTVVKTR